MRCKSFAYRVRDGERSLIISNDHRRSTTATAKMLDAVLERVKASDTDTVKIISVVSPLATCLMKNKGFDRLDDGRILRELQCYSKL